MKLKDTNSQNEIKRKDNNIYNEIEISFLITSTEMPPSKFKYWKNYGYNKNDQKMTINQQRTNWKHFNFTQTKNPMKEAFNVPTPRSLKWTPNARKPSNRRTKESPTSDIKLPPLRSSKNGK